MWGFLYGRVCLILFFTMTPRKHTLTLPPKHTQLLQSQHLILLWGTHVDILCSLFVCSEGCLESFWRHDPLNGWWPGQAVRSEAADSEGVHASLSSCWQASQTCCGLDSASQLLCWRFPPSRIGADACPCQSCPDISAILIGVPEPPCYFTSDFPHSYWTGRCSLLCEFLESAPACFNGMCFLLLLLSKYVLISIRFLLWHVNCLKV